MYTKVSVCHDASAIVILALYVNKYNAWKLFYQ